MPTDSFLWKCCLIIMDDLFSKCAVAWAATAPVPLAEVVELLLEQLVDLLGVGGTA